jgi:hypothetical protein
MHLLTNCMAHGKPSLFSVLPPHHPLLLSLPSSLLSLSATGSAFGKQTASRSVGGQESKTGVPHTINIQYGQNITQWREV